MNIIKWYGDQIRDYPTTQALQIAQNAMFILICVWSLFNMTMGYPVNESLVGMLLAASLGVSFVGAKQLQNKWENAKPEIIKANADAKVAVIEAETKAAIRKSGQQEVVP